MPAKTPRFKVAYPNENAQGWWHQFSDFAVAIDALIFAQMEAAAWIFQDLPSATIAPHGGGFRLVLAGDARLISRTLQTALVISSAVPLTLQPDWLVVVRVPAGATAEALVSLELSQNGVPIDPDYRVLGYVNGDYSITWWNAAKMVPGVAAVLFAHAGSGGGGGGTIPGGFGVVHVDAVYGSDTSGDGTPAKPYQTMVAATNAQPVAATAEAFRVPLIFVLAPGTYAGAITLPRRQAVILRGAAYVISGDIEWGISPTQYASLGLDLVADQPTVGIYGEAGALSGVQQPGMTGPARLTGQLRAYNLNVGAGALMPAQKRLVLVGIEWRDGRLTNQASGSVTAGDACGTLALAVERCRFVDTHGTSPYPCIYGEAEPAAAAWSPNAVDLVASWSDLSGWRLLGNVRLRALDHCQLGVVSHALQPSGAAYTRGWIDGPAPGLTHVAADGSTFRVGYAGTDPTMDAPEAVWCDSYSWRVLTSGGVPQFDNFDAGATPGGRGYAFTERALGTHVDSAGFVGNLSSADDTVQKALATLDALSPSGAPLPTGFGNVHVDAHNGSDTTGNGTVQKPYQTLTFAAGTVAAPGSFAAFDVPVQFVLAPGTYAGPIALPRRRTIAIVGDRWLISGLVQWYYRPEDWYGQSLTTYPLVCVLATGTARQAGLLAGLEYKNANPATLGDVVGTLLAEGVRLDGSVLAAASGGLTSARKTGPLKLVAHGCVGSGGVLGGEREATVLTTENVLWLTARGCEFAQDVRGCVQLQAVRGTILGGAIRWDVHPRGTPGGYAGKLGGPTGDGQGLSDCELSSLGSYKFGWDGATGVAPAQVAFDAPSARPLLQASATFDNLTAPGYTFTDKAAYVGVTAGTFSRNLTSADTTVQHALATLDQLVIAPGTLTGAVNPNGTVTGVQGQLYYQSTNAMFWLNTSGGTVWVVE